MRSEARQKEMRVAGMFVSEHSRDRKGWGEAGKNTRAVVTQWAWAQTWNFL